MKKGVSGLSAGTLRREALRLSLARGKAIGGVA
jgi:hypothetical protein